MRFFVSHGCGFIFLCVQRFNGFGKTAHKLTVDKQGGFYAAFGQHVDAAEKYVTENPSAHLHMYGKIEAKHNRKMGHVTLFSDAPDEGEERYLRLGSG